MDPNTQRAEAERWLGIAAKLLTARDFLGSRSFAIRARESDPNNTFSDQILAVVDTVLAGEKRLDTSQQPDWYAVLQLPRMVRDPDLIATHYRRLALLLSPDRNNLPFADYALQLTMDAWSVLSDPTKKWLFDNELAMLIQREVATASSEPYRVNPANSPVGSGSQLNTFQFFQPQPPPPPTQQQQPTLQMQPQQFSQREFMSPPPQPQVSQREFMPAPPPPPPQVSQREFNPAPPQPQVSQREFMSAPAQLQPQPLSGPQQLLPQWQMRDPTPAKGGEIFKGSINGIGGKERAAMNVISPKATLAPPPPITRPTPETARTVPAPPAPPAPPAAPPPPPPVAVNRVVEDGNANNDNVSNNNVSVNNANAAGRGGGDANKNNGNVLEEVESFWTACPYCFYIYEYQKMYQECTLRCQNCRRGFHALQIPKPPSAGPANGGKDMESSFCCWGYFPLGFSMAAWKKHSQSGNPNGSSNWMPFSPMFACPMENGPGGGNFQWFASNSNASVGPKRVGRNSGIGNASAGPRVYIDDDDEDLLEVSDPSDSDSSDRDWRNPGTYKKKKHNKGRLGGGKRGRPRRVDKANQGNQNSVSGGGVSVGGEDMEDGAGSQAVVVGLVAGRKTVANKNVATSVMKKQSRRSMKDMGRLDLNVEFNNEGDEHAATVSAVNREEDGIENIGFFEGLDEFLSTLPILNVGGDEKAKPS